LETADELWDLAGGNDETSDGLEEGAEDGAGDNSNEDDGTEDNGTEDNGAGEKELSGWCLKGNSSELVSPRSPEAYDSDDNDDSNDSGDDDDDDDEDDEDDDTDVDESHRTTTIADAFPSRSSQPTGSGSATQEPPANIPFVFTWPHGFSFTPSFKAPPHVEEDSAMDGVTYHPVQPVVKAVQTVEEVKDVGMVDEEVSTIASPVVSAFTFKPPKFGRAVPVVPSGFHPGNCAGGFDFAPPVAEDIAAAPSLSEEDGRGIQPTVAQEPKIDEEIKGIETDVVLELAPPSSVDDNVVATTDGEDTVLESPVAKTVPSETSPDVDGAFDILDGMSKKVGSLQSQFEKISATHAEADELEAEAAKAKELETRKPHKAVSQDCSDKIRQLAVAISACQADWLNANAGGGAPLVFVELASEMNGIRADITKKGDFSSSAVLSKMQALLAKWHALRDAVGAYIDARDYFGADAEFRTRRLAERCRADVEMLSEYEVLSQVPGNQEYWLKEAEKQREAGDASREILRNKISRMVGLHQTYYHALEALRALFESVELERFAGVTLEWVHEFVLGAHAAFELPYV
jgi:hypothetical protein